MGPGHFSKISNCQNLVFQPFKKCSYQGKRLPICIWRLGRCAIYFFYGLGVEIWQKSGVPHHPPELFIHLGGAIGNEPSLAQTHFFSHAAHSTSLHVRGLYSSPLNCHNKDFFCLSASNVDSSNWPKPGPKPGPSWKPKKSKKKILKIKIRSAQNVGKVWISREKSSWPHLGPSGAIFCMGRKNRKNYICSPIFAILPVWGHCCYPPEVGNRYAYVWKLHNAHGGFQLQSAKELSASRCLLLCFLCLLLCPIGPFKANRAQNIWARAFCWYKGFW